MWQIRQTNKQKPRELWTELTTPTQARSGAQLMALACEWFIVTFASLVVLKKASTRWKITYKNGMMNFKPDIFM